ncbi:putative endonuclease [Serratia phage vB_SmaM_ 2050HW]|uniref:Putative endonuclease n=1 Tax=Serratia phage vB_SmaM_ 2050HW TaxID=2024252 RepID=A0A289YME2_9CAUD|nr:putative endonuclease [Serratia phage vB_SmaM_ 2050HW]ATA65436.1 putative endonuclease [Serratia phage vB_SmaM_ 2050HW]UGO54064.1 putative endonuclease [Serratia phage vB_SmaM_Haymo]URG14277.1 HNH endonuclease [Pectobacterium phage vB_ParM-25]
MPIESIQFPGFYEIPGFDRYVISKEGRVVNKLTGTELNGSVNEAGYLHFRLTRAAQDALTIGRHRLMGIVFKDPGIPVDDLVINHLNGIKGDDFLDNLEWETYQGNAEHAGEMGLTSKCLPISVRDYETGEVRNYPSFIAYARESGMTKDAVSRRVAIGERRLFPELKQYRLASVTTPWYAIRNKEAALNENGTEKSVDVRELISGKVTTFPKASLVAIHFKVSPATVTLWLKQENQPVLPGMIQIKFSDDETPWREVIDPWKSLEEYTKNRVIVVTNVGTGEKVFYPSGKDCATKRNIKPTTLHMRLKSPKGKVFSDGCRYDYYSEI